MHLWKWWVNMNPTISAGIATYHPSGFVDGNNAQMMFDINVLRSLAKRNLKAIVISFEKVIYFNKTGVQYLHDILEKVAVEQEVVTGFVSYSEKHYDTMLRMLGEIKIDLYESLVALKLLIQGGEGKSVLAWHDDLSHKNNLVVQLRQCGIEPDIAKSREDFETRRKDLERYEMIFEHTILHHMGNHFSSRTSGNCVVYTMNGYLDASSWEAFDVEYHQNSLRVGFKNYILDAQHIVSVNVSGMRFLIELVMGMAEFGATLFVAGLDFSNLSEKMQEELEVSGIIFKPTLEEVWSDENLSQGEEATSAARAGKSLTKKIIEHLPSFVDSAMMTIETMTGLEAKKQMVKMQEFELPKESDALLGSSIGFYGDIDGIVMLLFPNRLAQKACSLLLGEEVNSEEVLDTLGEFVNIIAGQSKTALNKKKINIKITLPRTFADKSVLNEVVAGKKGVLVAYEFDGELFYFFLTR